MPIEGLSSITMELEKMIEKKLRTEILKARAAQLEHELAAIRKELAASSPRSVRARAPQPRKVRPGAAGRTLKPATRPKTGALEVTRVGGVEFRHRTGVKSVRTMLVETMSRHRKPMNVKRLGQILRRKGWKSTRRNANRTIDVVLRANPRIFRRIGPGQFVIASANSKPPA